MKFRAGHKTEHFKIIFKYPVTRKNHRSHLWAAKFTVENLFQGHEWLFKSWQPEQNAPITLSGIPKLSPEESLPTTRAHIVDWRLEKWSLQRERRWKEMQKKEKQIWTKSFSWILPAANCWFYFLSQLQVHSCLWVLWNHIQLLTLFLSNQVFVKRSPNNTETNMDYGKFYPINTQSCS